MEPLPDMKGPSQRWVEELHRNLHRLIEELLPITEETASKAAIRRYAVIEALFEGFIEGIRLSLPPKKGEEK